MNDATSAGGIALAHGSSDGHETGCLTARMCPNENSTEWLTCREAAIRRRGDYRWSSFPRGLAMPRSDSEEALRAALAATAKQAPVHGTIWGYARGCRNTTACPSAARKSCLDARREYLRNWRQARNAGSGRPVEHGTPRGYGSGCTAAAACPGDTNGTTCIQAQRAYKLKRARERGVRETPLANNVREAAERVSQLISSGVSIRELARLSGVGRTTLGELAKYGSGGRTAYTSSTAERILRIRLPDEGPGRELADARQDARSSSTTSTRSTILRRN